MISNIVNSLALLLSLVTAGSVFVHDTRIDKAAMAATSLPLPSTYEESNASKLLLGGDAHTHVERVTVSQAMKEFSNGTPRIQPRNDDKNHTLPKRVAKGHHAFDNYNLPIV
jgi:hypothetical protein